MTHYKKNGTHRWALKNWLDINQLLANEVDHVCEFNYCAHTYFEHRLVELEPFLNTSPQTSRFNMNTK